MKVMLIEIRKDNVRIRYTSSNVEIEELERTVEYLQDTISNEKGLLPKNKGD